MKRIFYYRAAALAFILVGLLDLARWIMGSGAQSDLIASLALLAGGVGLMVALPRIEALARRREEELEQEGQASEAAETVSDEREQSQ